MRIYREIPATPPLDRYVECFWTSRQTWGDPSHRVLPDGCIDLLVRFRGPTADPTIQFVGTMTRPLLIPAAEGPTEHLGIRFRPAAAPLFFDLPCPEIVNGGLAFETFSPSENRRLVERLGERADTPGRIRLLESLLARRQSTTARWPAPIREFLASLDEFPGPPSVEELSRRSGVSRQHLTRLFKRWTGTGPKQMSRILRFRKLLEHIDRTPEQLPWVDLALDFGYFDQSHLIRDFREFGDLRPGDYRPR